MFFCSCQSEMEGNSFLNLKYKFLWQLTLEKFKSLFAFLFMYLIIWEQMRSFNYDFSLGTIGNVTRDIKF